MVGSKGGLRSLSLVAIVVVLLLGRAADADPEECFDECSAKCTSISRPTCILSCGYKCGILNAWSHIGFLLQNIEEHKQADAVHYCKLGCASSVCSAIATTLRLDSSAGHVSEEAVKGSVKRCDNACSEMCIKHFGAAVAAA